MKKIYGNETTLLEHFEMTKHGLLCYKAFGLWYPPPKSWEIEAGKVLHSRYLSSDPWLGCGKGINVTSGYFLEELRPIYTYTIWAGLIPPNAQVVVPISYRQNAYDDKIRTDRLILLGRVGLIGRGQTIWNRSAHAAYFQARRLMLLKNCPTF